MPFGNFSLKRRYKVKRKVYIQMYKLDEENMKNKMEQETI